MGLLRILLVFDGLDEKAIEAELDGMLDFAATEIQKNVRGWRVRKVMKK